MAQDPGALAVPDHPTIVLIGPTGVGKSTFGNILLGYTAFKVSANEKAGTLRTQPLYGPMMSMTSFDWCDEVNTNDMSNNLTQFLAQRKAKTPPMIQVIDSAGLEGNAADKARMVDVVKVIKSIKDTSVIAVVVNATNARAAILENVINTYSDYIDADVILNHLIVVFTHWGLDKKSKRQRRKNNVTKQSTAQGMLSELQKKFPNVKGFQNVSELPCVFVDAEELADEEDDIDIKHAQLEEILKFYHMAKTKPQIKELMKKKKGECFSDNGFVSAIFAGNNGSSSLAKVKDMKVGDMVLTSEGYKKVLYVFTTLEEDADNNLQYVYELEHEKGDTMGFTEKHLVFIKGQNEPIRACNIKIGDYLQCGKYDMSGNSNGKDDLYSKVTNIRLAIDNVRSIITENGELIVNNIRASSYAYTSNLHYLAKLTKIQSISPQLAKSVEKGIVHMIHFGEKYYQE